MKKISKFSWFLIFFVIFLISLFFYKNQWNQVFTQDKSSQLIIQGESPVYEFVAETVKNNILSFRNPFSQIKSVLFPFSWRFAMDDMMPIFGIYFLFLRPFLSIHQSFMLIVLLGIVVSGLTMYYLLSLLKIDKIPALLTALAFCFSPFVSERIGAHPSYTVFYVFTLPAIFFIKLIQEKKPHKKYLLSALLAISFSVLLLTNLYFAVMMGIMIIILLIINYLYFPKKILKIFTENLRYFTVMIVLFFIILLPWIIEVVKVISIGRDVPSDWKDIIAYSADLTSLFIPLGSNPFYSSTLQKLGAKYIYISRIFENFIYPGLIIIISMVVFVFISKKLPKLLKPIFITALTFLILTFGPYLQVFGKNLQIPLPYIVIPYIPYIQMARSPGRFIVPFLFLSAIVTAFVIQYFIKKTKPKNLKLILLLVLFSLFIIDQTAIVGQPITIKIPNKIYKYLSKQKTSLVLEIPFMIRDSIKKFGDGNIIWSPYAQLLHHQQIFSVYAGRVPNILFNSYLKHPFIGPLGRIIESNPSEYNSLIKGINRQSFLDVLDYYQISHVIYKNNEKYSSALLFLFKELGFVKIISDGDYDLYFRKPKITNMAEVTFDSPQNELALREGWGGKEPNVKSRWMVNKTSQLFLSIPDVNKNKLILEGEPIVKDQVIKVYVNDEYAGRMIFPIGRYSKQELEVKDIRRGFNIITFKSKYTHDLSKIIPGSQDKRLLSLHVKYIGFK